MKTQASNFTLPALLLLAMTACSTTPAMPKNALKDVILNSHVKDWLKNEQTTLSPYI